MPRALSSVRLDEHATCKYVLFLEGLAIARTNDTTGALWGSGIGTWAYNSEVAIGGREIAGTREVVPGLVLPESVSFEVDLRDGSLQPSPVTFQLLDEDGSLAELFATEGQASSVLGARIAPGVADLGVSVATIDGVGTVNPRGRYIGIEKIGPAGERRQWPAIPFDLVGYDHPVHGSMESSRLPPVLISTNPIEFAGRMVTLYRIYRDPDVAAEDATAYYTWDEAHAAGDLVWWGVMRDAGRISGSRMWSIDCHGPDALMRKTLGSRSPSTWSRVSAELTLADWESYVAIGFSAKGGSDTFFNSSVFSHQITATNRAELITEINGWIETAMSGASVNIVYPGGAFNTWADPAGAPAPNPDAGILGNGDIFVRRERPGAGQDITQYATMTLAMHERAWRCLGFEPETQNRNTTTFEDITHMDFRGWAAGDHFTFGLGTDIEVPGDGYKSVEFTSIAVGYPDSPIGDFAAYANLTGGPRIWRPYHTSEVFILNHQGGQVVRVQEEVADFYLEGQLTIGYSALAAINGTPTTRARYFALRGEVVRADDDETTDDFEVTDAEDLHQVVLASWAQGAHYGTVSEGTGIQPALYVEQLAYPRGYGLNHERLKHDWAGKTSGEGAIEIVPLNAYRYFMRYGEKPWEQADTLLAQIMLSTGACTGYNAAVDNEGDITAGPNTHPLAVEFAGDYELADMGLGIPYQLVQHPADIRTEFATLAEFPYDCDLNRLRLSYIGPFIAGDVLTSITRPRLLCWSLAGKQYGLFRVGPVSPEDADITITEDDLYGPVGDPLSVVPGQNLRAAWQLDGVRLGYRWDPADEGTAEEFRCRSLDAGASRRTGDAIEIIEDHGLLAYWFGTHQEEITGIADWRPQFRQLWERDAAEFFARRHFSAVISLSRPKGQDAMPGSSVAVTNPWLVRPTGTYGVTGMTGRAFRATHFLRDEHTEIEAIVFAGGIPRHYSMFVRVRSVVGTAVEWYPDTIGHGDAAVLDGTGIAEPPWSSTGGAISVELFRRIGDTWATIGRDDVVSVNVATRTLVVANGWGSDHLRDRDHFMVISEYADQAAGSFPRAIFGVTTDTDLTIGDGTTPSFPFPG